MYPMASYNIEVVSVCKSEPHQFTIHKTSKLYSYRYEVYNIDKSEILINDDKRGTHNLNHERLL
jgi:hypothetical protein